jgi:hypothetical protein
MVSTVEVHIVSHYRNDRAAQLDLVLSAILGWKDCIVRTVITSNTDTYETSGLLGPYFERFSEKGHKLSLNVVTNLTNPRMLTWEHKKFIRPWLDNASRGEDFFLYIEDDIVFTNENLRYYVLHRKRLENSSLIPGFIRYETEGSQKKLVDITRPEYWQRDRTIIINGCVYHANINPYWAGFMIDRDMAAEYINSKSFSPTESEFVAWNIQERSAMGLTYERPRPNLKTRLVVPIVGDGPDPGCLVWHCSNTYSISGHPLMSKLTLEQAFQKESTLNYFERKSKLAIRRLRGKR